MGEKEINIDLLEESQEKLLENSKKSIEQAISDIKRAKKEKSLEKRIKELETEIEEIKKFISEDGFTKKIEEANKALEELNDNGVQKLKGKPTLVDFWADWCAPCRMIGKVVYQLKQKYKDTLNVVQIDTETKIGNELYRNYAEPCDVNAIPYLIVFDKDGNLFDSLVEANPAKLTQMVEAVLEK